MHVGIAGEVRCVVTDIDGRVTTDTGYQKNMILDTLLDFLGSGSTSSGGQGFELYNSCAIGSGNSTPTPTQTALDSFEYVSNLEAGEIRKNYDYNGDNSEFYIVSQETQYKFNITKNLNISEVGLVANKDASAANYNLLTRALIKDSLGNPTSISLKSGETLTIFYKLYKAISLNEESYVINLLDGDGGSVEYNAIVKPAMVGDVSHARFDTLQFVIGGGLSTQDLGDINDKPLSLDISSFYFNHYSYLGGYKKKAFMTLSISQYNKSLRSIFINNSLAVVQIRYGSVIGDKPIPKTSKDRLELTIEFSWGRYEGEL